jgi:hypothetical protein
MAFLLLNDLFYCRVLLSDPLCEIRERELDKTIATALLELSDGALEVWDEQGYEAAVGYFLSELWQDRSTRKLVETSTAPLIKAAAAEGREAFRQATLNLTPSRPVQENARITRRSRLE